LVRDTFADLLAEQVRAGGGRPVVTFYDDATGERVELSAVTYANWVAKTAGLLQDELGLERGGRLLVDLPTHWLGPVWLGAAWSVGLAVTDEPGAAPADVVVCGPQRLEEHAAGGGPVVALSLLPMAARFREPLPSGVVDYGAVVWGQPDAFVAYDPPTGADLAWQSSATTLTQRQLLDEARSAAAARPGTRLLTAVNSCTRDGLVGLVGPLAAGGGTVWVRNPDASRWAHTAEVERATLLVEP
jgi:uncharacterized protein (TIGR03089 family)